MKIAILGGGPIGIEAALYGTVAGFDVHVYERGRIGDNVRQWGYVRLFTEWERNRSPLAAKLLAQRGDVLPPAEENSTGDQLCDYLVRISSLAQMRGKISPQTEVLSVARDGLIKSDFWGDVRRTSRPFRVLTRGVAGEKVALYDAVLDCTGVYTSPNPAGKGGAWCPGETQFASYIDYAIPDIAGRDRNRFFNKHTLVVGAGHSAATSALAVADLMVQGAKTHLTWVVRRAHAFDGSLYYIDPKDTASGRHKLGERANALMGYEHVDLKVQTQVESLVRRAGQFVVTLSDGSQIECDNICAHTGFRPDPALWAELQIAQHPATGGAGKLADAIMESNARAGVGISTGYAQRQADVEKPDAAPSGAARELLKLDEPNFFVLGIKSYGRDAGFLMQNGFRQVRDVYQLLSQNESLDLYEGALDAK
jgi:hypothetical protein